jgi:hypothetical protein
MSKWPWYIDPACGDNDARERMAVAKTTTVNKNISFIFTNFVYDGTTYYVY